MPGWLKSHARYRSKLSDVDWDASGFWHALGMYCVDVGNNGRVPWSKLHAAADRKISLKRVEAAVLKLLADGLLNDEMIDGVRHVVRCDWDADQLKAEVWTDPVEHDRMLRRKQLHRDAHLCEQIRARDRNLCRYCCVRVDWKDRKGPTGGTYDHVDPDGPNKLSNVVVACRRCNGVKKDRTPEQAGMPLLSAGCSSAPRDAASAAHQGDRSRSRSTRARSRPDPDQPSRVQYARDVTYLAGSDSGQIVPSLDGADQTVSGQGRTGAPPQAADSTGGAHADLR